MSTIKNKTFISIWCLIAFLIAFFLIIYELLFGFDVALLILIIIMIVVGIVVTLMGKFFFQPKKICPKCSETVVSMYSEKCSNCGLRLIVNCSACGKYLNTYVDGKPVKFCNKCGLKIKDTVKLKDIIVHQTYANRLSAGKARFCPSCGSNIEEEENPKFCPLCGGKID